MREPDFKPYTLMVESRHPTISWLLFYVKSMEEMPHFSPPWVSISLNFLPSENFQTLIMPSESPEARSLSSFEKTKERMHFLWSMYRS